MQKRCKIKPRRNVSNVKSENEIGFFGRLNRLFIQELYGEKAKLPEDKRHSHVLRHSIAVHMLDAGQSQEAVKDRLGHKSIKSTDIYGQISNYKREAIGKEMERAREIVGLS